MNMEDESEQQNGGGDHGAGDSDKASKQHQQQRADTFPVRLHAMLEQADEETARVISWQPNGLCFKVHDKNAFVKQILPRWFKRQTQFASFQRQLNIYGFKQNAKVGKNIGAYQHPHFIQGKPQLVHLLERVEVKGAEAARENQYRTLSGHRKRKLSESQAKSGEQDSRMDATTSRLETAEPRLLAQSAAILRSIPETMQVVHVVPAPLPGAIGPIRDSAGPYGGPLVLADTKPHATLASHHPVHTNARAAGDQQIQPPDTRLAFPAAAFTDSTQTNLRLLDCASLATELGDDVNELLSLFGKQQGTTLTAATIQATQSASLQHPPHSASIFFHDNSSNGQLATHLEDQADWTDHLLQFGWNSGNASPAEVNLEPAPLPGDQQSKQG